MKMKDRVLVFLDYLTMEHIWTFKNICFYLWLVAMAPLAFKSSVLEGGSKGRIVIFRIVLFIGRKPGLTKLVLILEFICY